jgi:hypothetical protein
MPPAVAADHPDRLKWNAKYQDLQPDFRPHPLVDRALAHGVGRGPVLELACGPSGNALALLGQGRDVVCVDVSEIALELLEREAVRRGLSARLTLVHADLFEYTPPGGFALVLCTRYWERAPFVAACRGVAPGGLIAWHAFTVEEQRFRPGFRREWCLGPGEPASLLPAELRMVETTDTFDGSSATRTLVARRREG